MAQTCPSCGAKITCGCQRRTTADGRSACSKCVSKPVPVKKPGANITPVINNIKVEMALDAS